MPNSSLFRLNNKDSLSLLPNIHSQKNIKKKDKETSFDLLRKLRTVKCRVDKIYEIAYL